MTWASRCRACTLQRQPLVGAGRAPRPLCTPGRHFSQQALLRPRQAGRLGPHAAFWRGHVQGATLANPTRSLRLQSAPDTHAERPMPLRPTSVCPAFQPADKVPNASPTAASASSDMYGAAAADACRQLNERLQPFFDKMPGASFKVRRAGRRRARDSCPCRRGRSHRFVSGVGRQGPVTPSPCCCHSPTHPGPHVTGGGHRSPPGASRPLRPRLLRHPRRHRFWRRRALQLPVLWWVLPGLHPGLLPALEGGFGGEGALRMPGCIPRRWPLRAVPAACAAPSRWPAPPDAPCCACCAPAGAAVSEVELDTLTGDFQVQLWGSRV